MQASPLSSRCTRLLLAALVTMTLCQCRSIWPLHNSVTPPQIPLGSTDGWVKWNMGEPQGKEPWYYNPNDLIRIRAEKLEGLCCCTSTRPCAPKCRKGQVCLCSHPGATKRVGEIWQYRDDMNQQARWVDLGTGWQDPFASWDLYFDNHGKYVGWRLIEPLNAQGRARERFVTSDSSDLANDRWDEKVTLILKRLRDHLADPGIASKDVRQACRLASADLCLIPQNYRHKEYVDYIMSHCNSLVSLPSGDPGTDAGAQQRFANAKAECDAAANYVLEVVD